MVESSAMLLMLAVIASALGFTWIALAMDVHWQQVHGSGSPAPALKLTLRSLGAAGLLVSAVLCFLADRPSMAVLVWVMLLATSAALVAMMLAWRPAVLRAMWPWRQV